MKSMLTLAAVVVLGTMLSACGKSSNSATSSSSSRRHTTASTPSSPAVPAADRAFRGDEDDDDLGNDEQRNAETKSNDQDGDFDEDGIEQRRGYYDSDDAPDLAFGHPASASLAQQLKAVVKRYYAAGAADDGAAACALLTPSWVKAVPEDYGRNAGPIYLRGNTCAAVMTKLFRHDRHEVTIPFTVTAVRMLGEQALVLIGSRSLPARVVNLERVGHPGQWKLSVVLANRLP